MSLGCQLPWKSTKSWINHKKVNACRPLEIVFSFIIIYEIIIYTSNTYFNFNRCNELGLIERCTKIQCRSATNNELLMKHSQESIDILKSTDNSQDIELLEVISSKFDAVYFHPVSTF